MGCRLNQIESESAARIFLDAGFEVLMSPVSAKSQEDIHTKLCIINTCTVTQKAEQKARRIIRLLLSKYSDCVVIVTGCYAQLRPQEIKAMDKRISVLGGQIKSRINDIPQLLKQHLVNWNPEKFVVDLEEKIISTSVEEGGFPEDSFKLATSSFLTHSRASLKIQDGCNNNCAFCAIHIARGKSVSIDVETAIKRVKEIEESGNSEVVLTTVNIAQYVSIYEGEVYNFSRLLKKLLQETSKLKFRISSLYPEIVDDEFCSIISDERVQPHFHLSVQSGSDKVLKLMNRKYLSDSVENACRKLREVKKDPFIACDIITGFPGETDEDFEQTMELCHKCNFIWIHAFPYSERPGTDAIKMKNKVPQSVSGERAKRLNDFSVESKIDYLSNFVGKKLNAIIETSRKPLVLNSSNNKMIYHAVTDNFIHCEIITNEIFSGRNYVQIQITEVLTDRIKKGGEVEVRAIVVK